MTDRNTLCEIKAIAGLFCAFLRGKWEAFVQPLWWDVRAVRAWLALTNGATGLEEFSQKSFLCDYTVVSLRTTNYEAHNHLQVCDDVISTLPQEVYFGNFQSLWGKYKVAAVCKNFGMKVCEVGGWSHSDRFTTGEKSPATLGRKKTGPQCGVKVEAVRIFKPPAGVDLRQFI